MCKPDRRIGIIDLLASEEKTLAETYNNLERLRDPSHVEALSKSQMEKLLTDAGIKVEKVETRDVEVDFQRWVQMTGTKPETIVTLRKVLITDIGGSKTGMRPFMENDSLKFLQVWSIFIGTKDSNTNHS